MKAVATILKHHRAFAMLGSTVTVEKIVPMAWKGEIVEAEFLRDHPPGIYGFTSQEKRDKFVSLMNKADSETKSCVALSLQDM